MDESQKQFWESPKRGERRSPSHPVVKAFVQPKISFIKKHIPITSKTTLLDVGCGNGFFTYYFAKDCDVTGLDYSEVMLANNPHNKLIHGDAYHLPFDDNSFDVVFCSDMLHHLEFPSKAIEEMRRVSNNYVIVSEPNRNNILMFMFGLLNKEEWGSLKFTKRYLVKMFAGLNLAVRHVLTSGMIFPNKTPSFILSLFKIFDYNSFLGSYITVIAEKHGDTISSGVLGKDYARGRNTRLSWRYRLRRRSLEVIRAINAYHRSKIDAILDIGTAEGLMLSRIKKEFPQTECIGIEYSRELIDYNRDNNIKIIQGDAQNLSFNDSSFNIVIATAIIEHLPEPAQMLSEAYRVLKPGGILILTTPSPFFDKIAEYFNGGEANHIEKFGLRRLKKDFQKTGFCILSAERFMMSPIGFPKELIIEKIIKLLRLDFILLNQLIIGRKDK
jgi:ubiquinone/menaquinone biosynthesis C-methylase UbiE